MLIVFNGDNLYSFGDNLHEMAITKTRLYNFDPLKPHFYIVKLGFTGVYIIFFYFCLKREIVGTH